MRGNVLLATILAIALCACGGSIQHTAEIQQPKGRTLKAGLGDTVLVVSQKKSLPNAFGNADIFGRTTPTGAITVQYLGSKNGVASFRRSSMMIETGATTMNSTPLIIPTQQTTHVSGTVGLTPVSGAATTSGAVVLPATPPQAQVLPQAPVTFEINTRQHSTFTVAGETIRILKVSPVELLYRIE